MRIYCTLFFYIGLHLSVWSDEPPKFTLQYEQNDNVYIIDGFENRFPYYLKDGGKTFLQQSKGIWKILGDRDQIIKAGYAPNFFSFKKISRSKHRYGDTAVYSVVLNDSDDLLPLRPSPDSSDSFLFWDEDQFEDVLVVYAWVSEIIQPLSFAYLEKEGVKHLRVADIEVPHIDQSRKEGFPIILYLDTQTLEIKLPIKDEGNLKAYLNWLMKVGSEEEFLKVWKNLSEPPVYDQHNEYNLLMLAALYRRNSLIKRAKGLESYITLTRSNGRTGGHYAALVGNVEFVKQFEDSSGFNIETDRGRYPVHEAIVYGHEEVAKWWMETYDLINLQNPGTGYRPLEYALINEREEVFTYLMDKAGEDVNEVVGEPVFPHDWISKSFYNAIRNGHLGIVKYLLQFDPEFEVESKTAGVITAAISSNSQEMFNYIMQGIDDPKYPRRKLFDEHMFNPASFGLVNIIPLLVEGGVSANSRSPVFNNPALWTSIRFLEDNQTALKLLELGADPNLTDQGKPTCLELAFEKQDWDLVIALHEAGAKFPNNDFEANLVETAILNDRSDVVHYLINHPKIGARFLKEYSIPFLADYFGSPKVKALAEEEGLTDSEPKLESPSELDSPLKFKKQDAKPYPRDISRKFGEINTKVTAIFDTRGRLVLPKFSPTVRFEVYQYLKSMLMNWQIDSPRIRKKPAYIKVTFPIHIEDPIESNDPDKGLLRISKIDKKYGDNMVLPKAEVRIAPIHLAELRGKNLTHSVVVEVSVNEKGGVSDAKVIEHTNEKLAQNTIKAFKQWRFIPGFKNKEPVTAKLRYKVTFSPNRTITWNEYELVCIDC